MSPAHNGLRSVSSHFSTVPPHGRVPRGPIIRRFISSYESFLCPDIVIRREFAREKMNGITVLPPSPVFEIRVPRTQRVNRGADKIFYRAIIGRGEFFSIPIYTNFHRDLRLYLSTSRKIYTDELTSFKETSKIDFSSGAREKHARCENRS